MRILHITPFYPPHFGGISTHVRNLTELTVRSGNDFNVICPTDRLRNKNEKLEPIHRIPSIYLPPWPYPTLQSVSIPMDFGYSIHKYMKKIKPDLVHVHGHHYPISWAGLIISNRQGIPNVLTLHGMYALNPAKVEGQTKFEELFNNTVFKVLLSHTSAVIGLTKRITNYAQRYGKNNKTSYYTVPNGIETLPYIVNQAKRQIYRKNYGIKESSVVILFRGRFEEVKGIIEFCKAVIKLLDRFSENIEIIIVGDGKLKNEVNSIVKGKSSIHVLGWQPRSLVHELYILSDIFVIPSKFEALPITIVEAMNAGLHIVYTPVGGVVEILDPYSNKTQIDESSVDHIYNGLNSIITNSTYTASNIESSKYAESLDWKYIFPSIFNIYQSLVN
ncbi:glycosyltransferase family 4 protein [Candidatus Nitrosocosmicus sp. T]